MKREKNVLMLISDVNKIFHSRIRTKANENNLASCYQPIIFFLEHNDGLTQLDLVRLTRLKAPTISLTLQKMEQEGYVVRKPSEDDARKINIYLTDKGHEYDRKIISLIEELENQILPKLEISEKEELERVLTKLINIMCQEFGEYNNENI